MKVYQHQLKKGIIRTKTFEKKGLAKYAANTGLKCGHACTYCSTGAMVRTNPVFKELDESPFSNDYAIVDSDSVKRITHDAKHMRKRGMIQLCTTVDAWAPEAQKYDMGKKCLEAILAESGWTVRILTKNASVKNDYDLIEKYSDRVLVGLSMTSTLDNTHIIETIEPYASSIKDRMIALHEAHCRGLRTYGMLCPLLPGIADSPNQINELVSYLVKCGVEEIFAEAVNPRGRGLILTEQALIEAGYTEQAESINAIRNRENWSGYVVTLIKNIQRSIRKQFDINQLRFLQYRSGLTDWAISEIQKDDAGVIWL